MSTAPDIGHPDWCDQAACTAWQAEDGAKGMFVHTSTPRRVQANPPVDSPLVELFLRLDWWEPITSPPLILLRLTRNDCNESVEAYALASEQLRDLADAAALVWAANFGTERAA